MLIIFKVCQLSTLGAGPLFMDVHCFYSANAIIVAENIKKKLLKEAKLPHPSLSHACVFGHSTNDMNGSRVGCAGWPTRVVVTSLLT